MKQQIKNYARKAQRKVKEAVDNISSRSGKTSKRGQSQGRASQSRSSSARS